MDIEYTLRVGSVEKGFRIEDIQTADYATVADMVNAVCMVIDTLLEVDYGDEGAEEEGA